MGKPQTLAAFFPSRAWLIGRDHVISNHVLSCGPRLSSARAGSALQTPCRIDHTGSGGNSLNGEVADGNVVSNLQETEDVGEGA
jgi:hypothetical protein